MALVDGLMMASKFRGCLLGSLLGDCLGAPYEGDDERPSSVVLQNFFDNLEGQTKKVPKLQYTDDTTMTNSIAESLIVQEKLDICDLAKSMLESVEGRRENDVGGEGAFLENEKYHLVAGQGPQLDLGRRSFAPWPGSDQCGHFHVHFAKQKSLPMTALVSFPGSGNTWVRYLLETSSGIFTGSVYTDRQLISKGFYGEAVPADCGCTAVQKTHGFALAGRVPAGAVQRAAEVALFRGRAVLLLRNPYEALLSYRNFLYAGHTGFAPHDRFRGPEWERFASRLAVVWRELAATWINVSRSDTGYPESLGQRPAATVLHFERLRLDPGGSLRRLLTFLKLPRDPERIACALSHLDGPFRRPLRSPQRALFQIR